MKFSIITTVLLLNMWSCSGQPESSSKNSQVAKDEIIKSMDSLEVATLGAGCFWCVEAIFQDIKGVKKVESGYSGGSIKNPSYKEVCNGTTGHAEVVQVTFDPKEVAFSSILEVFFSTHDPTTLNRQGADVGTQYRSAIFYHSEEQKKVAELAKEAAQSSGDWSNTIVTEISAYSNFYKAEDYHQDYYNQNGTQPYCQIVITPKVDKFKKKFAALLKEESK